MRKTIKCLDTNEEFIKYDDYLKSKHWKLKRNHLFDVRGYKCEECGFDEFLHVHHITYKNIGNEKDSDLMVLCEQCHMKEHKRIKDESKKKHLRNSKKKSKKQKNKNLKKKKYKPQIVEKSFGFQEQKCIINSTTDSIRDDIRRTKNKNKLSSFDIKLIEFCEKELNKRKSP